MHSPQFIWCLKYLLRLQSSLQYQVINPSIYSLFRLLKNWYLLFAMELKITMYYLVLLVSIVLSKNIICYYFILVYKRVILHMMFIEFKLCAFTIACDFILPHLEFFQVTFLISSDIKNEDKLRILLGPVLDILGSKAIIKMRRF